TLLRKTVSKFGGSTRLQTESITKKTFFERQEKSLSLAAREAFMNEFFQLAFVKLSLAGLLAILPARAALSQADFYKGKTIKIVRGGGPGGSGEFQTRALVKFLEKYIPGKPTITVDFIEGAAGRKAANVIYSSTRPDGLTIGSIGAGLVVGPILGLPGSNYDLDKFVYL